VEGTADALAHSGTAWKEYEFKGKPGTTSRRPPQIAPYHLRLDWLMWFAAMRPYDVPLWFVQFVNKLLQGDSRTLRLLKSNPFPQEPPRQIRALLYEYRFTTPDERRRTDQWWNRTLVGTYLPPTKLPKASSAESISLHLS